MMTKTRFLIAACAGAIIAAAIATPSPAFAAPTLEIDGTNGTYKIYSLLNGDPSNANSMKFSSTSFPLSAWALASGSGDMNSVDTAKWIEENLESDEVLEALGKAAEEEGSSAAKVTQNEPLTLPAGYYLITGKNIKPAIAALSENDQMKMKVKLVSTPKFSEHIMIENGYSSFAVEKSDSGAGHLVTYRLECEIPKDYDNYETFFYRICDKLPEGVSTDTSKIDVMYCSDSDVFNVTSSADIAIDDNNILNVTFKDLSQIVTELEDGASIVVEFPARVSFAINCGAENANENEAWGIFGEIEEESNETAHDKSSFYSYKAIVTVENEEHEALEGASFVVADVNGHYIREDGTVSDDVDHAQTFESGEDGKVKIEGIGSGKYVLRQISAPDGYDGLPSISLHIMSGNIDENGFGLSVKASCEGEIKVEDPGKDTGEIKILATLPKRDAEGAWTPGAIDANSFNEATANSTADQFKPTFPTIEAKPVIFAIIAAIIIAIIIIISTLISKKSAKTTGKHPEYNSGTTTSNVESPSSIKEKIEDNLATGEQTPLTVKLAPVEEYPDETAEDRIEYDGLLINIAEDKRANGSTLDADLIDDDDDELDADDEEEVEYEDEIEEETEEATPEPPRPIVTIQPMTISKESQPNVEDENKTDENVSSGTEQPELSIEISQEDKYVAPEIANAVMQSFDTIKTPEEKTVDKPAPENTEEPTAEKTAGEENTKPKKTVDDFEKLMSEYRRLKEEIEGTIGEIEHGS